jgi:phage shock protein A
MMMSVFTKLTTLFRAGVRESAEAITDANAIRIYQQEIVDAQSMLGQRREALAAMIATRKELEREMESLQNRVGNREQQIMRLPAQERNEEFLQLAARDIAATELQLADSKSKHIDVSDLINREEITLRRLLSQINEHRRDIKLMAAQVQRQRGSHAVLDNQTVSGRLRALRETRDSINGTVGAGDFAEEGMEEAIERIEESPLDRKLKQHGSDTQAEHMQQVLARLRTMDASA